MRKLAGEKKKKAKKRRTHCRHLLTASPGGGCVNRALD
jgi:hypothetical protein